MRNVTKLNNKKIDEVNEFYELHSRLILDNIDVTDWTPDSLITFRIGIHISRDQRDWLLIQIKYPGKDAPSNID